jgi:hypothetical protein
MQRPRVSVFGLMALVLFLSIGIGALRLASAAWAGAMTLATPCALVWAILGVAYRRQGKRAFWLGFALFGWGYMILASGSWWRPTDDQPKLVTTMLLDRLYPVLRANPLWDKRSGALSRQLSAADQQTERILGTLERPISMPFYQETAIEDVIRYIKSATASPQLPEGLPIYVDPVSLASANKDESSPIRLSLEGIPLRRSLKLILEQVGQSYSVQDGLLIVSAKRPGDETLSQFQRVGHCLFALLLGVSGGFAGRLFFATRGEQA